MGMLWEFIKWTVVTQGLLLLFCSYFEAQVNAIYAIFLFSPAYGSCLLASFVLVCYYSKYFFVNILGRETGDRIDQTNKEYLQKRNLK